MRENRNEWECDWLWYWSWIRYDFSNSTLKWKQTNKWMNEWMSNPTNIDLNWVHTVIMYILYHKNEWWIVDKEISLNLYKVDQSCELQWDIWMIIRSNQWMNEWMNDILSKNWLTISRHYSQPMICKSVTRMSFIHSFIQSILFYIHSYNHIWFTLVWMADWMIESTNKSLNEWMNERFSLCGVIHKTTKTFITTNEL